MIKESFFLLLITKFSPKILLITLLFILSVFIFIAKGYICYYKQNLYKQRALLLYPRRF